MVTVTVTNNWVDYATLGAALVAAGGTVWAVVVALGGIRHERKRANDAEQAHAHERAAIEAERTASRLAARRAQAERVVAYARWHVDQSMEIGVSYGHWRVLTANYSDAPVFEIRLEVFPDSGSSERITLVKQTSLAPGESAWIETSIHDVAAEPAVLLHFRDVAGVWWRREYDGKLVEIASNYRPLDASVSSGVPRG